MLIGHLRRIITHGRRFIPEVDGLRFVAISAVVLYHLSGYVENGATVRPSEAWLAKLFSIGYCGVHLFFVLSGFLLALPFAKWRLGLGPKPSLWAYYCRRLTRLEPPYVVSMLLLFSTRIMAYGADVGLSQWPNLLASLLYQHNLIYGKPSIINAVAWSLEIEVQFYLLAPFLACIYSVPNKATRRAILLATMFGIPLLRSLLASHPEYFILNLCGRLDFFAAGFLLADFFLVEWKESPDHSWAWDLVSLVSWPALIALLLQHRLRVLIAPTMLAAYVGTFRGRVSQWLFSRPPITVIGGMCYSMYLLHYPVISLTTRWLPASNFTPRFAVGALIAIPAVLVVTVVFFVLLERPCMDPLWPSKARRWAACIARRFSTRPVSSADIENAPRVEHIAAGETE